MSPLKRTFWLGTGLILLTNALALGGVYYNRSGEPESVLRVSDRELGFTYERFLENGDKSGQTLKLLVPRAEGWVTVDKLRSLGFAVNLEGGSGRSDAWSPRSVLVVLELDGAAYQEAVTAARMELTAMQQAFNVSPESKNAKRELESAQSSMDAVLHRDTRLYAVDAGLDPLQLRQRYPDNRRFAIAQAQVHFSERTDWRTTKVAVALHIEPNTVSVPKRWYDVFSGWRKNGKAKPWVSVDIAFGKRFEPWIIAASQVD